MVSVGASRPRSFGDGRPTPRPGRSMRVRTRFLAAFAAAAIARRAPGPATSSISATPHRSSTSRAGSRARRLTSSSPARPTSSNSGPPGAGPAAPASPTSPNWPTSTRTRASGSSASTSGSRTPAWSSRSSRRWATRWTTASRIDDVPARARTRRTARWPRTGWTPPRRTASRPPSSSSDGKIAWIGHPMQMDEPLARITAGKLGPHGPGQRPAGSEDQGAEGSWPPEKVSSPTGPRTTGPPSLPSRK